MTVSRFMAEWVILAGFPTVVLFLFLNMLGVVVLLPSTVLLLWGLAVVGVFSFIGVLIFKFLKV